MALALLLSITLLPQGEVTALVLPAPRLRREVIRIDPVEAQIVTQGRLTNLPRGPVLTSSRDGSFDRVPAGYLRIITQSETAKVALLEASGHSMVYVNGEPRAGDPYGYGTLSLPVQLQPGDNEFLFRVDRGRLRFVLKEAKPGVQIETRDSTLPDLIEGEKGKKWAGIIFRNASTEWQKGLSVTASAGTQKLTTRLGVIGPLTIRKLGIELPEGKETKIQLQLRDGVQVLDRQTITLRRRTPFETHRRTFLSRIDGSVQYYGVNPSSRPDRGQALFLSLHGASVEAQGQAEAYGRKDWGHLVAATNRRPYGFDWEEIGRKDALEVLEQGRKQYRTDPQKTYLTGHSMGGHGTWQVGVLYPSLFGAIGPSAGWISFGTYAGGPAGKPASPVEEVVRAGALSSDTLALSRNYGAFPIYAIHGDADDNVPVTEARRMATELKPWHPNFTLYEQKGAGHWWDVSQDPGADCVDWAPLFSLFKKTKISRPEQVTKIDFSTPNPAISAKHYWAEVRQITSPLRPGRIQLRRDQGKVIGTTTNVSRLRFEFPWPVDELVLDDFEFELVQGQRQFEVERNGSTWVPVAVNTTGPFLGKSPERGGPFKEIFDRRLALICATGGTPEADAWAYNKARFDAETFLYRGNGSFEIALDTDRPVWGDRSRNVLLYGNSETNRAFSSLLSSSPISVDGQTVRIGQKERRGSDLSLIAIRPRKGSATALVGVVGGVGIIGSRLCDRMPFFTSGAAFPDWLVTSPKLLTEGASGLEGAGFFGNDWSLDRGTSAWKTP